MKKSNPANAERGAHMTYQIKMSRLWRQSAKARSDGSITEADNRSTKPSCLTNLEDNENVLELEKLRVSLFAESSEIRAVDGVSLNVRQGEVFCIVGESGCGKSVMCLSVMRLLPQPRGKILGGEMRLRVDSEENRFNAVDIASISEKSMRNIRGKRISMIFQEPMTSLDPVMTIGAQLREIISLDAKRNKRHLVGHSLFETAVSLLKRVGINNPETVYTMFPHQLSGGMRQRVLIAMAILRKPELIIADEPTTALDVTVQKQILELFKSIRDTTRAGIILITHDFGVAAEIADSVGVMYAGKIVERGRVGEIFENPSHPYTRALMKSRLSKSRSGERLYSIAGSVPDLSAPCEICRFLDRCDRCSDKCRESYPPEVSLSGTHTVCCFYPEKISYHGGDDV